MGLPRGFAATHLGFAAAVPERRPLPVQSRVGRTRDGEAVPEPDDAGRPAVASLYATGSGTPPGRRRSILIEVYSSTANHHRTGIRRRLGTGATG